MKLTKQRKRELVMDTMRYHASCGRHAACVDTLYSGAVRDLVRSGELVFWIDDNGQKLVRLPLATSDTEIDDVSADG